MKSVMDENKDVESEIEQEIEKVKASKGERQSRSMPMSMP